MFVVPGLALSTRTIGGPSTRGKYAISPFSFCVTYYLSYYYHCCPYEELDLHSLVVPIRAPALMSSKT